MRIEPDIKKTLTTLVVMAIVFTGASWWARSAERAELESRIDAIKRQLGVEHKDTQGIETLRGHVAELRRQSETANKVVPNSIDLADVLRGLNNELLAQNVKNQEMQTHAIDSGPLFSMIPLTLKFDGTYDGVFALVRSIESMPRLTRISKLDLVGVPTDPSQPLSVRLELMSFSTTGTGRQRSSDE